MKKVKKKATSPQSVLSPGFDLEIGLSRVSLESESSGASPHWQQARQQHTGNGEYLRQAVSTDPGCWQPPSPVLIYPTSPISPYSRAPDRYSPSAFAWHWQTPLPYPSAAPTRTVLVLAPSGLSEQQVRQQAGGVEAVRGINAIDPQGMCSAISFYDVRSATIFRDRISKEAGVDQAFCIAPVLRSPGSENQGTLSVQLGAATGERPDAPTEAALREAAEVFGPLERVAQDAADAGCLRWQVSFTDTRDAETAKHGLEGLEVAGRPAHIEWVTPPGAFFAAPVAVPGPPGQWPPPPLAGPPGSPSTPVYTMLCPPHSYSSYSSGSTPAGGGGEYMMGLVPASGSGDYSGLAASGPCLPPFSWSPCGSYSMYSGLGVMMEAPAGSLAARNSLRSASAGSAYGSPWLGEALYPPDFRASPGRSPRAVRAARAGRHPDADPAAYAFDPEEGKKRGAAARTTLMIRNIPNKYTQSMLLEILESLCSGKYDFFYLPIDYKNKCNLGYAFVNFMETDAAAVFFSARHHQRWAEFNSKKVCEVTYARVQGRQALVDHFRNSKFPCADRDSLPLVFEPVVRCKLSKDANGENCRMVGIPITRLCGNVARSLSMSAALP